MKNILFLLSLTIVASCSLSAQTARLNGQVQLADEVTPLAGITVYLEETQIGTATNSAGYFQLSAIPPGDYTLLLSGIGFVTQRQNISLAANEVKELQLTLEESINVLAEATVISGGIRGLKDIPGSVQYISPKEMQQFSYTDVNRVLRNIPGVNIQEEDGFGLRPNIGLRGSGGERSSKINVMEDGILMAPAPYAAPAAYHFPTVGRMQGVEVLKGHSQIKYGPYTTGGAINFISTQIPQEMSGRINLLAGSFGARNLHAYVGNSHQNIAYVVETFQHSATGFKDLDGGGDTGFNKQDFMAKFRINTNATAKIYQSLTFKIAQTFETSNETYLGLAQSDFDAAPYRRYAGSQVDRMDTDQKQFSLTHVAKFSEQLQLKTVAYRSDFSRNWYKLDALRDSEGNKVNITNLLENPDNYPALMEVVRGGSSPNEDALELKANNRIYYSQGLQSTLNYNFTSGSEWTHDLEVGIRLHQDQMDRFQWVDQYAMNEGSMQLRDAGTPGTESNRIETANALAAYAQYQLRYGNFTATPGLRHENIRISREDYGRNDPDRLGSSLSERENEVSVWIPGVGLDYRFSRYSSMFGGVHKGFSPPGSREGTLPEESINYELGYRHTKEALSGQAVLFFHDYSNLLGIDLSAGGGTGSGDLFNGGRAQSRGLELQIAYDLLAANRQRSLSLPISLSYTYTDANFLSSFSSDFGAWGAVADGDQIPYLAEHQANLMIGLEHPRFSVYLSGRYSSEMRSQPGQGAIANNESIDAYFLLDGSASYVLQKNISLFANAVNLSNQVYLVSRAPAGLRPGMPFGVNVGVKAVF